MVRPADVVQLAVFVGLSIVPAYSCLLPSRPKSEAPSIVLRHGILEIFIRLPSNLAQIKVVSFLTLNRNLFESTLEKNSARYPANDNNPDKSLHVFFSAKTPLRNAPNRRSWNALLPFDFVRTVQVGYAEHFDCRWAPPQFRCFPKFRRANWSRTAAAFRTFCHASEINFLQQLVHACPGPILPGKLNKRCELQVFSWRKTIYIVR